MRFFYTLLIHLLHTVLSFKLECNEKTLKFPVDAHYNVTNYVSNDPHVINIHLLPHTHDDPGWQKTVDQYYYGSSRNINPAGVQYILDNAIAELLHNPSRQFTYVEQSFFQRWWNEQSNATKATVRQLVKEGRLDLSVNGGWVMHDEATTHYTAMIDQTTLGHQFLLREFNVVPRVGWQIDPFGHSSTQGSYLTAGLGFIAYYLSRIDNQDFDRRVNERSLEFLWKPNPSDPDMSIFSGVLRNAYSPPGGFSFESSSEPIMDDTRLHDMNVCLKIQEFFNSVKGYVTAAKGRHVLLTMGDDFNYQNALMWFKNLDKTIHYFNQFTSTHNLHLLYSNLTYFTNQKLSENLNLTSKIDDFFPYIERPHSYWTGYFTSRPTLKRYARQMNSFLQAATQLVTIWHFRQLRYGLTSDILGCPMHAVSELEKAVALVQHHDAISGTEKQAVTNDYALRLYDGMKATEDGIKTIISSLFNNNRTTSFEFCWLRNVSICDITQKSDEFNIFLYNPLSYRRRISLEVPLKRLTHVRGISSRIELSDPAFIYDVMPSFPVPSSAPYASISTLLLDTWVDGFSYQLLHIHTGSMKNGIKEEKVAVDTKKDYNEIVLQNEQIKVTISQNNGSVTSFSRLDQSSSILLTTKLMYYPTYVGDGQKSGAYVFRPGSTEPFPISLDTDTKLLYLNEKGDFKQARFQIGNYGSLAYILRPNDSYVRVEWTVGSIPINNTVGKEVILRIDTLGTIASGDVMYTDSNGLMFMERKKNFRPTWKVNISEPVAGNYYPITSGAYIKDKRHQLNLVTDRAQGCGILSAGQVEVMLHRRLVTDDDKGAGEFLNETETFRIRPDDPKSESTIGLVARGNIYLGLESLDNGMKSIRDKMNDVFYEPIVAFRQADDNERYTTFSTEQLLSLNVTLPDNVHLLTLKIHRRRTILVRLMHKFAVSEDKELSKPVKVNLQNIFKTFGKIQQVKELSLSANQVLKIQSNLKTVSVYEHGFIYKPAYEIMLKSMQFRTFEIEFKK